MAFFEFDYVFFLFIVPGLMLVLLSAYVFWLDPGSRLGRSFALVSFLWGTNNLMRAVLPPNVFEFPGLVRNYVFLALPFAVAYFGFEFFIAQRSARTAVHRWVPIGLLAAAVTVLILYAWDHALLGTYDPNASPSNTYGPLSPLVAAHLFILIILAWMATTAYLRSRTRRRNRAFFLGAVAFTLTPFYFGCFYITQQLVDLYTRSYLGYYRTPLHALETLQYSLAPLVGLGCFVRMVLAREDNPSAQLATDTRTYGWLLAALAAAGIACGMLFQWPILTRFYHPHFFVLVLCAFGFAALLSTLVLRHHVLEIERHAKIVIRGGVVATVFVGVVFVAVELAAQRLSDSLSFGVGGIAAGLLLFSLHPLQRFAERLASRALPRGRPLAELSEQERRDVYFEQAVIAWADGALERKERLLLDRLRERLALTPQDAAKLEKRALQ